MSARLLWAWFVVGALGMAVAALAVALAGLMIGKPALGFALSALLGGYVLGLAVGFIRFVDMLGGARGED